VLENRDGRSNRQAGVGHRDFGARASESAPATRERRSRPWPPAVQRLLLADPAAVSMSASWLAEPDGRCLDLPHRGGPPASLPSVKMTSPAPSAARPTSGSRGRALVDARKTRSRSRAASSRAVPCAGRRPAAPELRSSRLVTDRADAAVLGRTRTRRPGPRRQYALLADARVPPAQRWLFAGILIEGAQRKPPAD